MEKIISTDCVRNEEVLGRVSEDRNILHTIQIRRADWIGHSWRRNWVLKHVKEAAPYRPGVAQRVPGS